MESSKNREIYGLHRVLHPLTSAPQGATQVNNEPKLLCDSEILIEVEILNLDSTSMRQISEASQGDHQKIASLILEIVQKRGKMHNPVTDSGTFSFLFLINSIEVGFWLGE